MSDFFPGFEPTQTSVYVTTTQAAHGAGVTIYSGGGTALPPRESTSDTSAKTVVVGSNNVEEKNLLPKYSSQAKQVGGDHYKQTTLQPWDVVSAWSLDPWSANVVKYIQRFHRKNGKEDLQKALHYLEYLIDNYDTVKKKYYKE
jgi:hypothetical protein